MHMIKSKAIAFCLLSVLWTGCLTVPLTPLQKAMHARNKAEVERLLQQPGARINARYGEIKGTMLYYVAWTGDTNMTAFLLSKGADPTISAKGTGTPLHAAAEKSRTNVITMLLDHGVDVDIRDPAKQTPLISAAWNRQPASVSLLLQRGADVNAQGHMRFTALSMGVLGQSAADESYRKVVKLLLQAGAKVNVAAKHGCTPLTLATRVGDPEVVKLLLDAGANTTAKDLNGETAMRIAIRKGNKELQQLIASYEKGVP